MGYHEVADRVSRLFCAIEGNDLLVYALDEVTAHSLSKLYTHHKLISSVS